MIDALAILVSCSACLYVAWRAAKLDKEIPWFGPAQPQEDKAKRRRGATRRQKA